MKIKDLLITYRANGSSGPQALDRISWMLSEIFRGIFSLEERSRRGDDHHGIIRQVSRSRPSWLLVVTTRPWQSKRITMMSLPIRAKPRRNSCWRKSRNSLVPVSVETELEGEQAGDSMRRLGNSRWSGIF